MTLAELDLRPDQVRSLFLIHLQQMHSAEEQLMPGIPTIAISISNPEIRQLLLREATTTPDHLELLQTIFAQLGEVPTGPVCLPIKALVDQTTALNVQHPFGPGRDLLLLAVAMEIKHLSIAKYTMAMTFARALEPALSTTALARVVREESEIERKLRFFLENFRLNTEVLPNKAGSTATHPSS